MRVKRLLCSLLALCMVLSTMAVTVSADDANINQGNNGKFQCYDKFVVEQILYDDERNIVALSILNTTQKKRVFLMDNRKKAS